MYAVAGGPGPNGLSYFRLRRDAAAAAKKRGNKIRKYSKEKGEYL